MDVIIQLQKTDEKELDYLNIVKQVHTLSAPSGWEGSRLHRSCQTNFVPVQQCVREYSRFLPLSGQFKMNILWFRRGLRLHDSPALLSAVENSSTFAAVYIFDPPGIKQLLYLLNLIL